MSKPTKVAVDGDTLYVAPPNEKFYIDSLWAYISEDEQGNEGVCGCTLGGALMPMIAADRARLDQLRPMAQKMAGLKGALGAKIKLVRFEKRVEVEEIKP